MAKTFGEPIKIKQADLPKDAVRVSGFTQVLYWCYQSEKTKTRY